MELDKTKDIAPLLSFFDSKKYDHKKVGELILEVISLVGQKLTEHKAGCAWVIMSLYKNGRCSPTKFENTINEFIEHLKGHDDYVKSVDGDKDELSLTYYNSFLYNKLKIA